MATPPVFKDWSKMDFGGMCTVSADGIIFRRNQGKIEVLVGLRGPGRWQAGKQMLTIGGMVDKLKDDSVESTVRREVNEEVPGMEIKFVPVTPLITGPVKYSHYWDPESQTAINTGIQVQDIPIITINFVVECVGGEPRATEEVPEVRWVPLEDIVTRRQVYAFDHAKAISHLLKHLPPAR